MYGKACKFTVDTVDTQGGSSLTASAAAPPANTDAIHTVYRVTTQTKLVWVKGKAQVRPYLTIHQLSTNFRI